VKVVAARMPLQVTAIGHVPKVVLASPALTTARHRGEEYLLERRLLRRLSTGEVIDQKYMQLSFPPGWHYDILRGLDYFRAACAEPDDRMAEALTIVEEKHDASGRWPLEMPHEGEVHFAMDEGEGKPGHWNTLNALRVLRWARRACRFARMAG
jgi:hypothetical protein